jgi:hypothetical protein
MKNHRISLLLIGALTLLSLCFLVSCKDDDDDLEDRVTVLEGMIRDLESQLNSAIVSGSTVTSASQDEDGVWTLNLSDGTVITIAPVSSSGSGSTVTVTESDTAFIISVDGTEYTIPKGASVNSLVFVDEYGDGTVELGNSGAEAKFLATPAISSSDLASATFTIGDAFEVKTRGGEDLFDISEASVDGDYIKISFSGIECTAGTTYMVAFRMTYKGTEISSNFFKVKVSDDFSFIAEALEDPVLIDEVTDLTKHSEDTWTATFPESKVDPLGTFNMKDLYKTLPEGTLKFQLAPKSLQNPAVQGAYDVFKAALSTDGTWELKSRPGTSGSDETNNGILIYLKANNQIKNKIYWVINDPIPGLGLPEKFIELLGDAPHVEYAPMVPAGVNKISITALLNSGPDENDQLWPQHDGGKLTTGWPNISADYQEPGDIFYNDGSKIVLGEYGEKMAKFSRGIWWQSTQPSVISSQRTNLTEEQIQAVKDAYGVKCDGEIINGYDGTDVSPFGISLSEDGYFETTSDYTGTGVRLGIGLRYEYAYGQINVGGWHLCYMFFNRRLAPEGAVDPSPKTN